MVRRRLPSWAAGCAESVRDRRAAPNVREECTMVRPHDANDKKAQYVAHIIGRTLPKSGLEVAGRMALVHVRHSNL